MNNYDYMHLGSGLFGVYLIYLYMGIFLGRDKTNTKREKLSYVALYIADTIRYILDPVPVINMLYSITSFFLITLNYKVSWRKRIAGVTYVIGLLLPIEFIVVFGFRYFTNLPEIQDGNSSFVLASISTKIIGYICALILSNFNTLQKSSNVPYLHWIAIFVIPSGTSFSTILLFYHIKQLTPVVIMSIFVLFIINLLTFHLYDHIASAYQEKMKYELLKQQNASYIKQFELIQQGEENIKILRHDLKQHTLSLQALLKNNQKDEALSYVKQVINAEFGTFLNKVANTGNLVIDSILNYKLYEAKKQDIHVDMDLKVPRNLDIAPFDLSAILGNLFDNAIEATSKVENKKIVLSIKLDRNVFFINIRNTYNGKASWKDNQLMTWKKDKENHGLGMKSIRQIIDKYNGSLDISYDDNYFLVSILMYNTQLKNEQKL